MNFEQGLLLGIGFGAFLALLIRILWIVIQVRNEVRKRPKLWIKTPYGPAPVEWMEDYDG